MARGPLVNSKTDRTHRILSGACAALLLAVTVFSSLFVAAEADHDCTGHDCPVCCEIQNCLGNFQLLGSSPDAGTAVRSPETLPFESFPVRAVKPHALTLQSLDVRFDE